MNWRTMNTYCTTKVGNYENLAYIGAQNDTINHYTSKLFVLQYEKKIIKCVLTRPNALVIVRGFLKMFYTLNLSNTYKCTYFVNM